jgi:phenylalanyl-tRNA synthetase alpha chain
MSNVPEHIMSKTSLKLHNKNGNPICLIKQRIYNYFTKTYPLFKMFDELNEVVNVENNFDLLLIPKDHPSRSKSDTYYLDDMNVLRTHTSAHQNELLKAGEKHFLVTGDVYRKDEIDKYHYPIFHQMEGVCIVENDKDPEVDLIETLSGLIEYLFPEKKYRFNKDYFPFTNPSFEIEVLFGEKWVEVLGCGVIHTDILKYNNVCDEHGSLQKGWAFGLGLERLAMILYSIPDIRLFWTTDTRFIEQFNKHSCNDDITFVQYPKLTHIFKDVSFWLNPTRDCDISSADTLEWQHQNEFFDIARECFGENVEEIIKFDEFYNSKTDKLSHAWRIWLSPNNEITNPAEFNKLCNDMLEKFRITLIEKMNLDLR